MPTPTRKRKESLTVEDRAQLEALRVAVAVQADQLGMLQLRVREKEKDMRARLTDELKQGYSAEILRQKDVIDRLCEQVQRLQEAAHERRKGDPCE